MIHHILLLLLSSKSDEQASKLTSSLMILSTAMPYNWTLCIVFRQCPGKLGLFIAGQPSRVKLLKGSLGPMGNAMDCKL
jgi:hypothetical protein